MDKIAIIKTGGKQYKVKQGQIIRIEKLDVEVGKNVKFETLMTADSDAKEVIIGKPTLGEKVEGKVIEQGRNEKVNVVKFKNKTRYKKSVGHRQLFTKVEIVSIA